MGAKPWKKSDPDSILILLFHKADRGGQIELIHVGMPDYDYFPITRGWTKYYWTPWKNISRPGVYDKRRFLCNA